ncbi:MAG TPA: hypothetical protein VGF13_19420 [Verrucomicrobiae bacterium]|jgi:hypothetical protein
MNQRRAADDCMKQLFSKLLRAVAKLGRLFTSKTTLARRAILRTETREREANEAERLDRLRNPSDYRGR